MGEARLGARLPALFLLAVAVFSAVEAWLAFRAAREPAGARGGGIAFFVLIAVFVACLLASFLSAVSLWSAPDRRTARPMALFGRNAEPRTSDTRRFRPSLLALPVVALAAAVVNHSGRWTMPPPATVEQPAPPIPAPPPEGEAASPPQQAEPPETVAAPVAPEPAVPAPPPSMDLSAPPPDLANPPAAAPPPEQAAIPPQEAVPAEPPVTTAPLPEPPKPPTAAEGHRDAVVWLDLAPDGHSLLSTSTDRVIKLWDIDGKHLIRDLGVHKDMARTALFMPDGLHALTAGDDGEIVLRTLADGRVLHVFAAGENGGARKLAISPDGKHAVSGHESGNVIVWDIDGGKALHVLSGHAWSISAVAVSPDGRRALTSSIDGELRLWDIDAGTLLRRWQGHERGAYGAVFTADGHHAVTGSGDYTIKLWDLDTYREIRRFDGHSGTVYALALSSDGKRLASASLDGSARLWDMDSGNELALFDPGTGPIYSVAFAPDGSVLTGGVDRTIRRWPAQGGDGAVLFAGAPDN
jgi:dipeptidyl aminopeptidase/acylaminoacyl peptidase